MYAYIKGILAAEYESSVVVDNGGIGYLISVSARTVTSLPPKGSEITLFTEFTASENAGVVLYGFLTQEEKDMFVLLLTVSGIGPKVAMAVLSVLSPRELTMSIAAEDEKSITRANGVGPKAAKRIILELKDKVDYTFGLADEEVKNDIDISSGGFDDVLFAMTSLGYSSAEALSAIRSVEGAQDMDSGTLLRESLKKLAL